VIALLPFCAVAVAALADRGTRAASSVLRSWIEGGARRPSRLVGAAALVSALAVGTPALAYGWSETRARHGAWNANGPTVDAERWLSSNVDHRARVLVDDTYFVDLVHAGFDRNLGVVWFYKLDFSTNLDPSVTSALPRGYKEFDYVVSSPTIRAALNQNPNGLQEVRQALTASTPVVTFGVGDDVVEIRRLNGPDTGSGRLGPVNGG
jgi:hypothetical protein